MCVPKVSRSRTEHILSLHETDWTVGTYTSAMRTTTLFAFQPNIQTADSAPPRGDQTGRTLEARLLESLKHTRGTASDLHGPDRQRQLCNIWEYCKMSHWFSLIVRVSGKAHSLDVTTGRRMPDERERRQFALTRLPIYSHQHTVTACSTLLRE